MDLTWDPVTGWADVTTGAGLSPEEWSLLEECRAALAVRLVSGDRSVASCRRTEQAWFACLALGREDLYHAALKAVRGEIAAGSRSNAEAAARLTGRAG